MCHIEFDDHIVLAARSLRAPCSQARLVSASTFVAAQRGTHTFEPFAQLEQFRHVGARQPPDDRTALMPEFDKAFRVEPQKCLADRAAADVELGHEVRLDQPLPRGESRPSRIIVADRLGREERRPRPRRPWSLRARRPLGARRVESNDFFCLSPCVVPGSLPPSIQNSYWSCSDHWRGRAMTTSAMPETGRSANPAVK